MTETTRGSQENCWDDKKDHPCVINIFCGEKQQNTSSSDKEKDGHCIINIFCDKVKSESLSNSNDKEGHCIINIFCNDKKNDGKPDNCNCEKNW